MNHVRSPVRPEHRVLFRLRQGRDPSFREGSSVDEDSVVQGAQLVELSLDVGVELVEIRHVVLRGHAVSCNEQHDDFALSIPPSRPLFHAFRPARTFLCTFT